MFEIERVRDRERKIGYSLHKEAEALVRDRERFEIEGVRDRESQLYIHTFIAMIIDRGFLRRRKTLIEDVYRTLYFYKWGYL